MLFQALLKSIQLYLSNPGYPTGYARFLMKCIKAERFDLCIETGREVRKLTSDDGGWEAGTTIVMRVVFEEPARRALVHKCRSCGSEMPLKPEEVTPVEWLGFFVSMLIPTHTDVTSQPRMPSPPSDIPRNTRKSLV